MMRRLKGKKVDEKNINPGDLAFGLRKISILDLTANDLA